ncbi:MAG: hypothetical protein Q6362_007805 [Candidatus Wukongarchaeota archaeon]|nr:hypothetical protein [Candidatus Wukongarchaeota archaeon]
MGFPCFLVFYFFLVFCSYFHFSGFRSYLNDLASSILEKAEKLRESRSTRRKQLLCVVVDLINDEGLSTFKGQRSRENTLKGSKPLMKVVEAFGGVFERPG